MSEPTHVRIEVAALHALADKADRLDKIAQVACAFIDHYLTETGCSNCGGIPHSTSCFVRRFQESLL